jgi:hypothetical protein
MSFGNRVVRSLLSVVGVAGTVLLCNGAATAAPAAFVEHSDVATGITSDAEMFVSLRYMRHLWIAPDGVQVAVVQQGTGGGLGLFDSVDDGLSWSWEQNLPGSTQHVSDGIMLDDGSLLLVTSMVGSSADADVDFIRMNYDPAVQEWSVDPLGPTRIYDSNQVARASRASIAMDGNGVLWCAFRLQNTNSGNFRLRLFSSSDDGLTWQDSLNLFGTANGFAEKDAKVLHTGMGIGIVFQDMQGTASNPVRTKAWAYRDDSAPLQQPMTTVPLGQMTTMEGDPHGSHWSVAADSLGNVHLAYQDGRIQYMRLDAATQTWSTAVSLGTQTGSYNSVTVTDNDDVYVFARFASGTNIWVKRLLHTNQQWSGWLQVSENPHPGLLRMCSPEHVDDRLPLLYQVNGTFPVELLHAMLDV